MKVCGQLHASDAYYRENALPLTPVPNGQEIGWGPEQVWMLLRRQISCPCRKQNPLLRRPAPCPTLYRLDYPSSTKLLTNTKCFLLVVAWFERTELASRVCFLVDRTPSGPSPSAAPLNWLAISNHTSMLCLPSPGIRITARAKNKKFCEELEILSFKCFNQYGGANRNYKLINIQ
jgi:hypothetical protein